MYIAFRKENPKEWANVIAEHSTKCKCGHSIVFPNKTDKVICSYCGNYVFKDKKVEFNYRLQEEMRKSKIKGL